MFYRVRQFWYAWRASPARQDLDQASKVLTPKLMALFLKLEDSEQAHSLSILNQLKAERETNVDLMSSALLHDIGKSRFPLKILDRVLIVLAKKFIPGRVNIWGQAEPKGWKLPFVVAEQHAAWGAEMAAKSGASPMTVALIRRHQEPILDKTKGGREDISLEDQLLTRLQFLDNQN